MENKENKFKRRFYHRGVYLSEPDLTTADRKAHNSGFPPGITVDELRYYRRKRLPSLSRPKDHLHLEEGRFDQVKTEYKRRFRDYYLASSCEKLNYDSKDISPVRAGKPNDTLELSGSYPNNSKYYESHKEFAIEDQREIQKPSDLLRVGENVNMALYDESLRSSNPYLTSENQSQFIKYGQLERAGPIRRSTNLKLEGDFLSTTEKAEQFVEYLLSHRRDLIRNPTHLKMEGDMARNTEMSDQFVALDFQRRPSLCKRLTNLHLEGEFDRSTESGEQFKAYDVEKRRPLIKRNTNLQLEGDLILKPEYQQAYVKYNSNRTTPNLPQHNLKCDGFFDRNTENKTKFVRHEIHPTIPFLRVSNFNKKLLLGDDKPVKHAEYRENYIPHNIERSIPLKPHSQLTMKGDFHSPGRGRMAYSPSTILKTEGYINDNHGEYRRSFVDFPRERPSLKKPKSNLSSEGKIDHLTEKRAQYVEHPQYHKMDSLKREPEFKIDGEFECQPEYRKAYIDYLIRERVDRKPRPLDNLSNKHAQHVFEILSSNGPKSDTTTSQSSKMSATKSLIPVSIRKTHISTTESDTDRSSSTLPRTKSHNVGRRKSIGNLETQVFGTTHSSSPRTPSSIPPKSSKFTNRRTSSVKVNYHKDRTGSRFTNTVRVEDLAYTPCTSPIATQKLYTSSPRKKGNQNKKNADCFYVLEDDINNNCYENYEKALHSEQKWMPSWYNFK